MDKLSQEEVDALLSFEEVSTSDWIRLKRKIFVRLWVAFVLTCIRVAYMIYSPQTYSMIVYQNADSGTDDLVTLAYGRLFLGFLFFFVTLYALKNNLYLRSVSMAGVVVVFALFWSDLQVYIIGGFSQFTAEALAFLILRLWMIYLITANYFDIRR